MSGVDFSKFKPENKKILKGSGSKNSRAITTITLRVSEEEKMKALARAREDGYRDLAPALVRVLRKAGYL